MLKYVSLSIVLLISAAALAQPQLNVSPAEIVFEDAFDRLKNIQLINTGDSTIVIDTFYYKSDLYFMRYNDYYHYPIEIEPNDTLMMDCILSGYLNVTSADTSDAMYIISNSIYGTVEIKVKVNFYDDSGEEYLTGKISDGINPLPNVPVNFYYEGNSLISTVVTDIYGNYHAYLPHGRYTAAAVADSFYLTYYGQQTIPYYASLINLEDNIADTADIQLKRIQTSGNIVSGKIYDSLSITPLKKAIIVIRKGNHTPRKISKPLDDESFSAMINPDGTYEIDIPQPGHYFLQAFSDYYLPAYYKDESYSSSVFWQDADSIYINGGYSNVNIFLPRDSSFGAGIVSGRILLNGSVQDSLPEILVFAQHAENNYIYSYAFSRTDGEFKLTNLPYGRYKLFVQQMGYENSYSDYVEISPATTKIYNVNINVTSSTVDDDLVPDEVYLFQNYPNPFNPSTTIEFSVPSYTEVRVRVTNIIGELVQEIYNGNLGKGIYSYTFDGSNLSSGAYIVSLHTNEKTISQKVLLLK